MAAKQQSKRVVVKALDATTITQMLNKISNYSRFPSVMGGIDESEKKVKSYIGDSKAFVGDAFGNKLTATGTDDKIKSFNTYGYSNDTLNILLWTALYNDSWVFKRVIDKPAEDILKLGIILNLQNKDVQLKVEKDYRNASDDLTKLYKWGRLYGGAVAVMMFDTYEDKDYAEPYNKQKIRTCKTMTMYVTDRWYGCSTDSGQVVTNMNDIDYGKPKEYEITFADGKSLKVHHDYILRYEHRDAPNLIKNGALMGWGYAEGSHILNELSRDDQLKADITSLLNKSLIEVIKMAGMTGLFLGEDDESRKQIEARLSMINAYRSFNSLTFLDSEDEYQMNSFSGLGGLSDLLETNMWLVAAACDMQGILFGDLKNGMGNDSDALVRYDDVIQTAANSLCRVCTTKFLRVCLMRYEDEPESVDFEFGSLRTTEKEEKRNKAIDDHIARLSKLRSDGLIGAKQYLKSLKKFIDSGVVDFDIDDTTIAEAEQREKEESEGFVPNARV